MAFWRSCLSVGSGCTLLSITTRNAGRLLALADVELDFDGVPVIINSVRLEREADGVSVRIPIDRDGRPLVVLPDAVKDEHLRRGARCCA